MTHNTEQKFTNTRKDRKTEGRTDKQTDRRINGRIDRIDRETKWQKDR